MRLKKAVADLIHLERICRIATAGPEGMPHLVPVCQIVDEGRIYFASAIKGRKVDNLKANPQVTICVDLYSEAWANIKGVMVQGRATLIGPGPRFRKIRRLLYMKYSQYEGRAPLGEDDSIIVEVTPTHAFTWGLD
jgi:nitroimidazol reductase NimA-like FMN-containing flavoprotein (pyridoxamine 5'-phosphate oxidase superfamily)